MANFEKFANGGLDEGHSTESTSIRHRQTRDNRVGSRMERVWATDFKRCESREDFEKYISRYERYESNEYVSKAKVKIESLDAVEKAKVEREKANQRPYQRPVAPGTSGGGIPPKYRIVQTCIKALVWIVIIGGVGLYSYNQYKQSNEATPDVVTVTNPTQHQDSQNDQNQSYNPTHSEQTDEPEDVVSETESEPQEIWWDCKICGTTGRCQLCFGSGRCAVCGGGRQVFSVFDGGEVVPGRMTDCGNCDGSGSCPSCEGSGACFACHGQGRVKSEF